jgi:hypothetical protein
MLKTVNRRRAASSRYEVMFEACSGRETPEIRDEQKKPTIQSSAFSSQSG